MAFVLAGLITIVIIWFLVTRPKKKRVIQGEVKKPEAEKSVADASESSLNNDRSQKTDSPVESNEASRDD